MFSKISNMISNIIRIKPKIQVAIFTLLLLLIAKPAYAIVDPSAVPNNKFGIHIIQATPDESSPAASLVNTNGDWGYITVLIEQKDKNKDKWQEFFNDLRRRHLIPIVRLATEPQGNLWKIPNPEDADSWADFLNSLNWPTKNRYLVVFNEPNHGQEWGGAVDAKSYANTLDKLISALKKRSEDFFIMNAGFDASAPQRLPNYQDEISFLQEMKQAVPDIFERLDGWVSHSYPNPEFSGSPDALGRGTVRTWFWELQQLRNLGVVKNLPVFITETGWKHSEGLNFQPQYPSVDTIAGYYQKAYEEAWNSSRIIAVTPFLLSYQEPLFDHFSFKRPPNSGLFIQAPGENLPAYYPHYEVIKNMPKVAGQPVQENKTTLIKGEVFSSVVSGEAYTIFLTFKNSGQSIWNDGNRTALIPIEGSKELGIENVFIPDGVLIEPGTEYTFQVHLKAPLKGKFRVGLSLFSGNQPFDSKPVEFITEVKEPVILQVLTKLKWRNSAAGEYILRTTGTIGESTQRVVIDKDGKSTDFEARYLLPDYTFNFTLEKPNYKVKTISKKLNSGENILDFGTLQPDLLSNLFNFKELWKLLPFSN